jgi:hypothetical protein
MERFVSEKNSKSSGQDRALAGVAAEVQIAQASILSVLAANSERPWRPSELISEARAHLSEDIPNTVMSIAFWNLVQAEKLVVDANMTVHNTADLVA